MVNTQSMHKNPDEGENNYALVKTEDADHLVLIPIGLNKPVIPDEIREKWQKIVDLVAGLLHVPTGLITRLTRENLEIFVAARKKGNPYKRDDRDRLGIGMFCETVAGRNEQLLVENAEKSEYWKKNPHASLGMKSYLGVPIKWNDGELFGTFCMLDDKANAYSEEFIELMKQFRDIIESDLENILLRDELSRRLGARELQLREIHHRLKNQFNVLIGYINLKAGNLKESDRGEVFREIKQRVIALSIIHEELYKSDDISTPSLDIYLPRLCEYIRADFSSGDVAFSCSVEKIKLSMEHEMTLALILSELMTNSIKHAFRGVESKRIELTIRRSGTANLTMTYRDSGVGFPEDFNPDTAGTLGMVLVRGLTEQLEGVMRIENSAGAVLNFEFRI